MGIRRLVGPSALCIGILSALVSLGCGGGVVWPNPTTIISGTQNPLVAQYNLVAPHSGSTAWVEFGENTNYGRQTSVTAPTSSSVQPLSVLVAGMKASTTYHMRAHVDWPGGSWVGPDQTFKTGTLAPPGPATGSSTPAPPVLAVTRSGGNLTPAAGIELLDLVAPLSSHTMEALATDLDGNVIWYYDVGLGNSAIPVKPLPNGHMIMNVGDSALALNLLREIDLAGNTIRELPLTALNQKLQNLGYQPVVSLHHDLGLLPNGHTILLANMTKPYTDLPGYPGTMQVLGDVLIDLDPNWDPVWVWSCFDHLDVNRHLFGLPDWTHSNTVVYDSSDGNLLLSMRAQSWIIKIDYQNGSGTGNILWRLGEGGDFTLAQNDPSKWFYGQHRPAIVSTNGAQMTLSIMDNGNFRILDDQGDICSTDCYSRAVIFQIDQTARTANLIWAYDPGVFSFWGGNTRQLPNGDVEFDLTAPYGVQLASQITELTGGTVSQLVWQMNIQDANAYRGYRIPSLYPGVTWQY